MKQKEKAAKFGKKSAVSMAASVFLATTAAFSFSSTAHAQCGKASWYQYGSKTANGERMNANAMTAAHRTLKFGTKVKVVNKRNGRSVVVRINDRGPFIKGRIIDVTRAAAKELGFIRAGHTPVCLEIRKAG